MPLLTAEQLQEIRQIIEDHHDAFIVNTIGPEAVPAEVLDRLREMDLVDVKVDSVKDAYVYGQLLSAMQSPHVANMSFEEFKAHVARNPIPLSAAENHAVQMAQINAGQYCKGLGNRGSIATLDLAIEADTGLRARTEGVIQDATALNIARRETVQKLKSDLSWATREWNRDWTRIAVTEKQNAMQRGVADQYRKEYGPDVLVARRAMPDACPHCRRLYNGPDGQPRIFKLRDLEENGTNVGRKTGDWLPVAGVTHPNCFEKQTLISTDRGEVPIAEVRIGDKVLGHDSRFHRVQSIFRSEFEGELLRLSGKSWGLKCTPNHPFYVNGDWVRGDSLKQGTHLIQKIVGEEVLLADDDPKNQPPMLNKIRGFFRVIQGVLSTGMPITAIDFNGDLFVREGKIDVVDEHGKLGYSGQAQFLEFRKDESFSSRIEITLTALSYFGLMFHRIGRTPAGFVCGSNSSFAFLRGHLGVLDSLRGTGPAGPVPGFSNAVPNNIPTDFEFATYFLHREQVVEVEFDAQFGSNVGTSRIAGISNGVSHVLPSFGFAQAGHPQRSPFSSCPGEAEGFESTPNGCGARSEDFSNFTGELFLVKELGKSMEVDADVDCHCSPIIAHQTEKFKGVVYNLSVEGAESYFANGILVHNCQCQTIRIPAGFGFNEEGQVVPGGELGIHYDSEEDLARAMQQEADLQKAFRLRGHVNFRGIPIAIENPAGSVRTWKDGQGGTGETKMQYGYGYIKRTNGIDEDEIDAFVGPDPRADMVYVIEQQLPKEGRYDEAKCFLGFSNQDIAEQAYQAHFDRPDFQLYTTAMPLDQFKRWIQETAPKKGEMMKSSDSKFRLVIPFQKARVTTIVGAATSQAGNQSPSQYGTTPNYVFHDIPERPQPASLKDVGYRPDSRELAEHFYQDFEGVNPLKVDKEVYHIQNPVRFVRPIDLPTVMDEAQEMAREGAEDRMRYLFTEKIRNAPRPKNKSDIEEAEDEDENKPEFEKGGARNTAPTLDKQGQFNVISIGPRGGKIIGYKSGKPMYLHKLTGSQRAQAKKEAKGQQGKKVPKREPVPKPTVAATPPKSPPAAYVPDPTPRAGQVAEAARVGVPAEDLPPPPAIPRLPNLSKTERAVEGKFASTFEADPDGMASAFYDAMAKNDYIFETDAAKALSSDWDSPESRGKNNTALHQTANAIAKRAFVKRLDEIADMPENERKILVTSGGVAGGKGSALAARPELAQSVAAVWDAAGEQNATENPWILKECEKRGIKPVFLFVSADPGSTWEGAIARAKSIGRMVDARVFADSYAHGTKNFATFKEKNKDRATFVIAKAQWPKPAEFVDSIPEEALAVDADDLYKKSMAVIAARKNELPAHIVAGAIAGARIWGQGVAK